MHLLQAHDNCINCLLVLELIVLILHIIHRLFLQIYQSWACFPELVDVRNERTHTGGTHRTYLTTVKNPSALQLGFKPDLITLRPNCRIQEAERELTLGI